MSKRTDLSLAKKIALLDNELHAVFHRPVASLCAVKGTSQSLQECLHVSCSALFQDESVLAQLCLDNRVRPRANPGQVWVDRFCTILKITREHQGDACGPSLRKTVEVGASTATLFIKGKCEKTYRRVRVNATTRAQPYFARHGLSPVRSKPARLNAHGFI